MAKNYEKLDKILRSDLASEWGFGKKSAQNEAVTVCEVVLSKERAERIGKGEGRYVTYETKAIKEFAGEDYDRVKRALSDGLGSFVQGDDIFVVGLGNSMLVADSLGSKVCSMVNSTRNIIATKKKICCLSVGVLGRTGIESWEVVKGVVSIVKPSTVLVVDSLCAGSYNRLFSSFQISDAGIVPGSGVGNHRIKIDSAGVGCKVVSVGVPTVVYASTLVVENKGEFPIEDMVVTPKDIDIMIQDSAEIIAGAINSLVF